MDEYLQVLDPSKQWVRDRLVNVLNEEGVVPSFSEAAVRLLALTQNPNTSVEELSGVIALDPGLATRCLQVASSVAFAARPIDSVEQAIMMIGVRQIRRIALSVGTIDTFAHFKLKIDWKRFWLHNILVARLSDKLASTFRECSGLEYLAGLLHDIGKLIIERFFPREFEQIVLGAYAKECSHAAMERELLGIDHTQIGAAMCELLEVHNHLRNAIRFHHDPLNRRHRADAAGDGGFLAACVSVADQLANSGSPYFADAAGIAGPVEKKPEWLFLCTLAHPGRFDLNLPSEIEQAQSDLQAFA